MPLNLTWYCNNNIEGDSPKYNVRSEYYVFRLTAVVIQLSSLCVAKPLFFFGVESGFPR